MHFQQQFDLKDQTYPTSLDLQSLIQKMKIRAIWGTFWAKFWIFHLPRTKRFQSLSLLYYIGGAKLQRIAHRSEILSISGKQRVLQLIEVWYSTLLENKGYSTHRSAIPSTSGEQKGASTMLLRWSSCGIFPKNPFYSRGDGEGGRFEIFLALYLHKWSDKWSDNSSWKWYAFTDDWHWNPERALQHFYYV